MTSTSPEIIQQQLELKLSQVSAAQAKAAQSNAGGDQLLYEDMKNGYLARFRNHVARLDIIVDEIQNTPPDQKERAKQLAEVRDHAPEDLANNIALDMKRSYLSRHPQQSDAEAQAAVKRAFENVKEGIDGTNPFKSVAKTFYDNEKGGLRYGGIIGAILGLLGGLFLTKGMNANGFNLVSLVPIAAFVGLFAWGGMKGQEKIEESQAAAKAKEAEEKARGQGIAMTPPAQNPVQTLDRSQIPPLLASAPQVATTAQVQPSGQQPAAVRSI